MATFVPKKQIFKDLNKQQEKAAVHREGPALVLAGAGSGKTRVIAYRAAYLMTEFGVSGNSILMLTFTNKAAGEMEKRIRMLSNGSGNLPVSGTFHSIAARILRQHGSYVNIPVNFTIYDETDKTDAIKLIMKALDLSTKNFNPNAIAHVISDVKNELLTPVEYAAIARGNFQETVALVYRIYQKEMEKNGALDFDDLLLKTVRLLKNNPEIRDRYLTQFEYLFIDEFQDTNKAQYVITGLLTGPKRNVFVVGDAAQSIYRWRGADYKNILAFKRDNPGLTEYRLDQNYRSSQIVLDAAYAVISKNTSHPILSLWTDRRDGEKITLYEARNETDEAVFLAQTILQSGLPFSDFAVLYRTNAQSRVVEEAFLHAGIPYILVGGIRFYDRKEIKDILSYLRVIYNPNDRVSETRIGKIGKNRQAKFGKLAEDIAKDNKLVTFTTLELMDMILDVTRYPELYDANTDDGQARLDNIAELRSVATQFPVLTEFLENVALVEQEYRSRNRKKAADSSSVTLMTMHAAKGLEFPNVYVIGMEEGLFPHSRSLMDREALEEERRLCYVAITRAKNRLYLTYANRRLYFGTRTQNAVSRFVADIPAELLSSQVSLNAGRGFDREDLLL